MAIVYNMYCVWFQIKVPSPGPGMSVLAGFDDRVMVMGMMMIWVALWEGLVSESQTWLMHRQQGAVALLSPP